MIVYKHLECQTIFKVIVEDRKIEMPKYTDRINKILLRYLDFVIIIVLTIKEAVFILVVLQTCSYSMTMQYFIPIHPPKPFPQPPRPQTMKGLYE